MMLIRLAIALLALIGTSAVSAAELTVQLLNEDGKPLADAVLYLPIPIDRTAQPQRATVTQRNRVFDPFVTVIEKGGSVEFPNEDTMLHHVYSFSPAKRFEIKLYKGTPPAPVTFDTSGIVVLGCNMHDWMLAYIVVLDTRFHTKTGGDGVARLTGVPAGTHDLMAWYPGLREPVRLQQIELSAKDARRIDGRLKTPLRTRPRAPPTDPMRY